MNEIVLDKGNSSTITITSGDGSFIVYSNDVNIAEATINGSMIIITGIKGGTPMVKATDTLSGNIVKIKVTVNDVCIPD